jgi:hypothetical protein
MSDLAKDQYDYINSVWKSRFGGVYQAQAQVLNWLFAVQLAGIAGTLGRASSRGMTCNLVVSLICFCAGLLVLVAFGALMFYLEAHHFGRFRDDVMALTEGKMLWPAFIEAEKKRPIRYPSCEFLAWLSAVLGIVGIVALTFTII